MRDFHNKRPTPLQQPPRTPTADETPLSARTPLTSRFQIHPSPPLPKSRSAARTPCRITKSSTMRRSSSLTKGRNGNGNNDNPTKPRYHLRIIPSAHKDTKISIRSIIDHLSLPLVPLISVTTGLPHPSFPVSLLQYNLLTHSQLDSLALFYHQVSPPVRETRQYPMSVKAWVDRAGAPISGQEVDLQTKRRRWGRFVGLRGCESPVRERFDNVEVSMDKEWEEALRRAREDDPDEVVRRKVGGY